MSANSWNLLAQRVVVLREKNRTASIELQVTWNDYEEKTWKWWQWQTLNTTSSVSLTL